MTRSLRTYTGADYNLTVALLVLAFAFSPSILMLSRPAGFASAASALCVSTLCVVLAWISRRRFPTLTIASVVR
jgi:hypothetical protein